MAPTKRMAAIGLALLALALGFRLYGLDWGLPAVYEEAYPFKKSWEMWGWGAHGLDLNPHFFNYPSLYFYVQFLGQGLLYLLLHLRGTIESTLDYRVLYALDKTSFYLMGRGISALIGAGTVLVVLALGRRVGGLAVGVTAALLVAVNQTHISKSQVIEVDVPMTLLATLCCLFALRILDEPRRRDYVLAGIFGGLASSTKYNGALLALPIFLAHQLALMRGHGPSGSGATARPTAAEAPPRTSPGGAAARRAAPRAGGGFDAAAWKNLGLAAAAFAGCFIVTSPYVLLDRENFWIGFNYERLHMRLGHFGLDDTPAFLWYLKVMTGSLLGWPLAFLSAAGFVLYTVVRRRRWALVLAVFPVVYVAIISGFAMKAERYVLPLLPIAAVFAAALLAELAGRLRRGRVAWPVVVTGLATVVLAAPSLAAYRRDLARLRGDTRTLSREWIEANVPAGSFLVIEPYGPEPMGVIDLANLDADVRERIAKERPDTRLYAVFALPMYQVRPENTGIFYDLRLYDEPADVIVTSSSVSSRYRKDLGRYRAQNAFYDSLAARWKKLREFGPEDGAGPRLTIWGNPSVTAPFSKRQPGTLVAPAVMPDLIPGSFAGWFERLGYDYEAYGYNAAAAQVYQMGLRYPDQPADARQTLGLGAVRTSLAAKRNAQAAEILQQLERVASGPSEAAYWRGVRRQLKLDASTPQDSAGAGAPRAPGGNP